MSLHKPNHPFADKCPVRNVLDKLGDRWTVLILSELKTETLRFGAFKKRITDISPRMLAQTLRQLEQDGLIDRQAYATIPPRVDYSMTALGHSFHAALQHVVQWADDHHDAVRAARLRYVAPMGFVEK